MCCKIAPYSELIVDSFFEKILSELSHMAPAQTDHNNNFNNNNNSLDLNSSTNSVSSQEQEVEEVEIFPDATWTIAQKQKTGSEKKRKANLPAPDAPAAKRIGKLKDPSCLIARCGRC